MEASIADLVDSTVSGNTANNGGGIFTDDVHSIWSSTIAENTATGGYGGGLFVVGTTVAHGSIITDNDGLPGYDNCTNSGVVSRGHNIESTDTCELGVSGDQPATDPLLGPLADNGGPARTHALLVGSPAINGGASCSVAVDQRYAPRDAQCDIGAFEFIDFTTVALTVASSAAFDIR